MQNKKSAKKKTPALKNPSKHKEPGPMATREYTGEKQPDKGVEKMPATPAELRQERADELLRRANMEIKNLRAMNQRYQLRAQGWDEALSLFNDRPLSKQGGDACLGSDLVYSIERHLNPHDF